MYNLPLLSYKIPMAYTDGTCVTDFKPSYSVGGLLQTVKHLYLKNGSDNANISFQLLTFMTYKPRQERQTGVAQCTLSPPSGRVLKQRCCIFRVICCLMLLNTTKFQEITTVQYYFKSENLKTAKMVFAVSAHLK